jgi:hypothetical protein
MVARNKDYTLIHFAYKGKQLFRGVQGRFWPGSGELTDAPLNSAWVK